MHGLILSGGRGTRLGPLSAQLPKCLLTVGQKPQIVRHVQQLRASGCDDIHVVVSPAAENGVKEVLANAGIPDVHVVVQRKPDGPGDAIAVGLRHVVDEPVILIMSDTLLADEDIPTEDDVVSCTAAPSARSWCYPRSLETGGVEWCDGPLAEGELVSVGAYRFASSERLSAAVSGEPARDGMAWVLNSYGRLGVHRVTSWLDIGDIRAMAAAQRSSFIARAHHTLQLDENGCVVKRGKDLTDQVEFMEMVSPTAAHLFPRIFSSDRGTHLDPAKATEYTMDFVDLPSLAELWLYWPSTPDMWEHIGAQLWRNLTKLHHTVVEDPPHHVRERSMRRAASVMYTEKLLKRYTGDVPVRAWGRSARVMVNGKSVAAGVDAIHAVASALVPFLDGAWERRGIVHGDPAFANVLWSLRSDTCKLIDPRGNFGNLGAVGDIAYDLGKVFAAPTLAAVMHQLFTLAQTTDGWTLDFWPQRDDEVAALRSGVLSEICRCCTADRMGIEYDVLVAYMLLSSAPLHEEPEATALYLAGLELAHDIGITR